MGVRKRKDSGGWQAGWSNPEGKWRTKDFSTKREALGWEAKISPEDILGEMILHKLRGVEN